jgi:flagellar hook assembly protein FlgD/DNA/RNA endonuclease YhcR with UshA esterase domain
MNSLRPFVLVALAIVLILAGAQQSNANVFASNIRITQPNSDLPFDAKVNDGTGVGIRFVLSDHADSVIIQITRGATFINSVKGYNFNSGDTLLVWNGKDFQGNYVATGDYSFSVSAMDKGYNKYTEIFYNDTYNIFTRGVTAITNEALKNYGFIYSADNGGYNGQGTGIVRHSADGRLWGNAKGVPKLNNTGAVVGPANLRYSSEATEDGYIYLIGRDNKQIFRYHTDTMNVAMVDSGGYTTNLEGLAVTRTEGGGHLLLIAGNAKVYMFSDGGPSLAHPKAVMIDGDTSVVYWDVQFGRDSIVYATYYGAKDQIRPGVAKFNFSGWDGVTPRKLADAVWTATVDSGRGNTMAMWRGQDSLGSQDLLYFTIARRKASDPNAPQKIYVVKNLSSATPTLDTVYSDKQNNMTQSRSDIAVDAVGNIIYFENSNEEVVLVSPPTGPNNRTTQGRSTIKVISSESISAVRRATIDPFKPDRLNDTVTVIGTVNSVNPTASANRFSYFIQDDSAGINITKGSVTGGGPVYSIGTRLVAKGVVGQNRGTTQLNILNMSDVSVLDSGNTVTPIVLSVDQYLSNAEKYESRLIKFLGVTKTAASPVWPALGVDANMIVTDGFREVILRLDSDTDIDGTTEPVWPVSVQGVATQFTSATTVYNDGYQISANMRTDIIGGVQVPPNRYFSLLAPANLARVVLNDTAQTVQFLWRAAVDLNGDQVIYQWLPVGSSAVVTGNAAKDTMLIRTGKQLLTYLGAADSVNLKWTAIAKDPTNPPVYCKDTMTVKLVRGTITGVNDRELIPTSFSLSQNYPNPFNPSTTLRFGLPSAANVTLRVYDYLGREIATLMNEEHPAGYVQVVWNGTNTNGARVASGVYFYRIEAQPLGGGQAFVELKKMVLVK